MGNKLKIAVTPRHVENKDGSFLSIERRYLDFWSKYGYELSLIPFIQGLNFEKYFEENNIKALLIAGGYKYYSEEIRIFEKKVIDVAIEKNIPVIGVCCGLWSINGYFGGKLKWNEKHSKRNLKYLSKAIPMRLIGKKHIPQHGIKMVGNLMEKREAVVNSFHRKVIDRLGDGLKPFIYSDDGEIEGIYNLDKKIIALQFHLEHGNCSKWFERDYMSLIDKIIKNEW